MKTNKLLLVSAILATMPVLAVAAEREVKASELPPAAQRALDDASRGETVKKIAVRNAGGRVVYDVELERANAVGERQRLRIAEDGKILGDSRKAAASTAAGNPALGISATGTLEPSAPVAPLGYPGAGGMPGAYPYEPYLVPATPKLRIEELPKAAQETIRREAANREVAAIHEDTVDGRKAYVAQFSESGRNPRVFVAEDGSVLRPTEKPRALALGTTFSDTPAPVQQAIRRELGEGEIVRIDKEKEGRGEMEIYQVEVKDARGSYHVRIAPDGRVLENPRKASR